jgi:hypothetical protein
MAYVYFIVTVMQFMPQLNSSDILRNALYQPAPTRKVFTLLYETLRDTGILTDVRVAQVNRDVDKQANAVQW